MQFHVEFTTGDKDKQLLDKLGSPGLDIIDLIRKTHEASRHLPADKIVFNDSCPINGHCKYFCLSEDQAREANRFAGKTEVNVLVPEFFMGKFVDLKTFTEYETVTTNRLFGLLKTSRKEVYRTVSRYVYDEQEIIRGWLDAGAPLSWE